MISTDPHVQKKVLEILQIIRESSGSVGAGKIADKLRERGYEITERGVGYYLRLMDEMGLTRKMGHAGRTITSRGIRELEEALAVHRVSLTLSRIEEKVYMTNIDIDSGKGDTVVNVTYIPKEAFERAWELIQRVCSSGFVVCRRIGIEDEGSEVVHVPPDNVALLTVCSMTVDGILTKHGIPVDTQYAGTLYVRKGKPQAFVELIGYGGVSIDPMSVFLARHTTSVLSALDEGGTVLANVREVLYTSVEKTKEVLARAQKIGIGGVVGYGESGKPYLRVPVGARKVALPVYAGVNVGAALEEVGIEAETCPVYTVLDYRRLRDVDDAVG